MSTLDIEKTFLSFILKDISHIETCNIIPEYLRDAKCSLLYKLIFTYYENYLEIPTDMVFSQLLKQEFNDNQNEIDYYMLFITQLKNAITPETDFKFICDTIKNDNFNDSFVKVLHTAANNLNFKGTKENYDELFEGLMTIKEKDDDEWIKRFEMGEDFEERLNYYDMKEKEMLNKNNIAGISSGIAALDQLTGGWRPAELVIFMANSGEGKSVLLLNMAHNAYNNKANVLFVSLEMSYEEKFDRYHSLLTSVDYGKIRKRGLSEIDKQEYYKKLAYYALKEEDRGKFLDQCPEDKPLDIKQIIESVNKFNKNENYFYLYDISIGCNVGMIEHEIKKIQKKHKLDIVVIDYLNIMDPTTKNNQDWIQHSSIARELKLLSRHLGLTVLTAVQMGQVKEGKELSINNMNYAKAIGHHADYLIGFKITEQDRACSRIRLELAKHRNVPGYTDGKKVIIPIKQLFDKMKVENFYELEDLAGDKNAKV